MQLMLDLEVNDSQTPAVVWAWTQAFSARVLARTGRPLLMYTGYYFWRDSVGNPTDNLNAPLWIAAYIAKPLIPTAWPNWTFWQHDDNGRFVGIDGNVDVRLLRVPGKHLEQCPCKDGRAPEHAAKGVVLQVWVVELTTADVKARAPPRSE
jgi:GH25 family lysozyme M1 (1,4-beta-N-acetylmuramidase)